MTTELFSVFLVGLLGGVHCAGMCGGLISALSLQIKPRAPSIPPQISLHIQRSATATVPPLSTASLSSSLFAQRALHLLCYNIGRLGSYIVAGAIAGSLGSISLLLHGLLPIQQILFVLANLMLILLGLYLSGLWQGITLLERTGQSLWKYLQPFTRHLLPIHHPGRALAAGALWGWVPCGMVYSVLILSLISGSPAHGALLMLAFGLGTLPNLLLLGALGLVGNTSSLSQRLMRHPTLRKSAGLLVGLFGVFGLLRLDPLQHLHALVAWCFT